MSHINEHLIKIFPSKIDNKSFVGGRCIGTLWLPLVFHKWITDENGSLVLIQERMEPLTDVPIILADENFLYVHALHTEVRVSSGVFDKFKIILNV